MAEFEKIPEPKDKFTEFQKKYNVASKGTAKILGANIAMFVCILLPVLLICFIWADVGIPTLGVDFLAEGILTVTLFVIGEMLMARIGADGGKLDTEYIDARTTYETILAEVHNIGTTLLNTFCDRQIDVELEHAIATRLRALYLTQEEWENIKNLPFKQLKKTYGRKKAKAIESIRCLKPIELNEAILLFDSSDSLTRGGVPVSGDVYIRAHTRSIKSILVSLFTGVLTVSIAITLTSDISWARVVYTIFKLVVLLFRMALGYSLGAKAFNTMEVVQLQAKCNYLRQYKKFVLECEDSAKSNVESIAVESKDTEVNNGQLCNAY